MKKKENGKQKYKYNKQSLLMSINCYKWVRNVQLGQVSVVKVEKLCAKMDEICANFVLFRTIIVFNIACKSK